MKRLLIILGILLFATKSFAVGFLDYTEKVTPAGTDLLVIETPGVETFRLTFDNFVSNYLDTIYQVKLSSSVDITIHDVTGNISNFKEYISIREAGDAETFINFFEAYDEAGDNKITLKSPTSLPEDFILTLPSQNSTVATIDDVTVGGSHNTNMIQFKNGVLNEINSGSLSPIYIATDNSFVSGSLTCDGTTITGLVITVEHSTTANGLYTLYGNVSATGSIIVSGWADAAAGTWIRARVSSISTGDATTCWLPLVLVNN